MSRRDDPYRQAHPRRVDWWRVVQTVAGALLLAVVVYALLVLALTSLGATA